MAFTFLHCADIHLGAQSQNEERYDDFFLAFAEICSMARKKRVNAVLIAGDFFHCRSIDARTLGRAENLLCALKNEGIEVIAIEGNHDKAFYLERQSWMQYLDEVGLLTLLQPTASEDGYVLQADVGIWESADVRILGLGYLGSAAVQRLEQLARSVRGCEKPTVAMLHAGINRLMAQDMGGISKEALEPFAAKVNYFALGHIHTRYEVDGWAHNPGAPECVRLDEGRHGDKGCYLVSFDPALPKKMSVQFLPVARRDTVFLTVDVSGAELEEVRACIEREIANYPPEKEKLSGALLRVTLQGEPGFTVPQLDLRALETDLRETTGALDVEMADETVWRRELGEAGECLDREVLECDVLEQMAGEMGVKDAKRAAAAIVTLKTALLGGEEPDGLIDFLAQEADACT